MENTLLLPSLHSDDEEPDDAEGSDDDEMDGQFEFGGILASKTALEKRSSDGIVFVPSEIEGIGANHSSFII